MEEKKLKLLEAMDSYLPHVDGVITCMHQYCTHAAKSIDVLAAAPAYRGFDDSTLPYPIRRCRSIYIPILGYNYGRATHDAAFRRDLMAEDFDIVHVNSPFNMADFALALAREKGIPAVATFHSNMRPIFQSVVKSKWLAECLVRHVGNTYNRFDEIFVCSPLVAEQCRSFGYTGRISYLPFGTKLPKCDKKEENIAAANERLGIGEDEVVFLYVGRIEKLKRIDFILGSLALLKKRGIRFRFFVVGKGSDAKRLQALADSLGFTEQEVTFLGFVEEGLFPLLYSRADLLLFPSLYDNFGLVKVEAASFDTPGVFIEGSCAGYGVTHGVNGYLSPDSEEAFADTVEAALSDRAALRQAGYAAGRDLYISWEDCTEQFITRLREVVARYQDENKK